MFGEWPALFLPLEAAEKGGWEDCQDAEAMGTWMQENMRPDGHRLCMDELSRKHVFTWSSWLSESSLKRVPLSKILQFLGTRASFPIKLQQANEKREQRQASI